jgi:TonB family protein
MCSFTAVSKHVVPFVVAFAAGIIGSYLIAQVPFKVSTAVADPVPQNSAVVTKSTSVSAFCVGRPGSEETSGFLDSKKNKAKTERFKITSKPKATYTEDARTNNVEGAVRLKVTLLASGQVGAIRPVSELPFGLTEQAVAAARNIKFQPKRVNGVPQSVIVTIEYNFNLY